MVNISRRNFFKLAVSTATIVGTSYGSFSSLFLNYAEAANSFQYINGVHHIAIYVTDMAKTIKYYEDVLGMKFLTSMDAMEGDKPLKISFMALNDLMVELLQPVDTSSIVTGARATQNHICLRTNDAHGLFSAFKKKGVEIEVEPFDSNMQFDRPMLEKGIFTRNSANDTDLRLFFIRGINGERFEIIQDDLKSTIKGTPQLLDLHHSGVYVTDIDKAVDFYSDTLGFKLLYKTEVMEGNKLLKMAWIKQSNLTIELLQLADSSKIIGGARSTQNHVCLRTSDMASTVKFLKEKKIEVEAGPFDTPCKFNERLENKKLFIKTSPTGTNLKIFFVRCPNGERYEVMQDNIG